MGRSPCCSKIGLNRGSWTALEDKILTDYITLHGEGKWRQLPIKAGTYIYTGKLRNCWLTNRVFNFVTLLRPWKDH
ncbi:putative transcription factor MYB-HB-like family [Helianthus anomalus]